MQFSDESSMRLYRQTVEDFGLYTGKELSDDEMTALRDAAGRMSAKMRAVRIVSASSVSKKDLQQRLVRKGEDPDQAREAVAWMSDLNLLDDARVAEQVVSRCISKGYGLIAADADFVEFSIPQKGTYSYGTVGDSSSALDVRWKTNRQRFHELLNNP